MKRRATDPKGALLTGLALLGLLGLGTGCQSPGSKKKEPPAQAATQPPAEHAAPVQGPELPPEGVQPAEQPAPGAVPPSTASAQARSNPFSPENVDKLEAHLRPLEVIPARIAPKSNQ